MDDVFSASQHDIPADRTPEPAPASEASRYFAAAAYRDARFRGRVLALLRHGWYRARAPEFGIDEQVVAAHCHRAERREVVRDAAMVLAFLTIAHRPLGWLIYRPDSAGEIVAYFASDLALAFVAAVAILFAERLWTEHFTLIRMFGRNGFAAALSPADTAIDGHQNLVVYGGYLPFVGSGYAIGGWSFSVNLERTRDELGVAAKAELFDVPELLLFIEGRLDRLHISGLRHYEMLFADGRVARESLAALFADRCPKRRIPASVIARLGDSLASGTRSYLCINLVDWSGEIVISIYLRCRKGDSSLFVEASYFLLPPPKRDFFKIDEADPQLRLGTVVRILSRSSIISLIVLPLAAFRLFGWATAPITHWLERRQIRRAMRRNPRFNVGAVTTIRELGMENYYRVHFQQLDKERHVKTIEQCTIDAIVEFLAAHNIDTSDIRDRRTTILNNGVMVAGGALHAENMAVGGGAKATIARLMAGGRSAPSGQSRPQPVRSSS